MILRRGELTVEAEADGYIVIRELDGGVMLHLEDARWLMTAALPALIQHSRPVVIVEASSKEGQLEGQLKIDS